MSPPPPAISRASGGAGAGRGGAGRGAIFSADTALTPDTTTWPGPGACLVRPRQVRGQTRGHKAARRQVAGGRRQVAGGVEDRVACLLAEAGDTAPADRAAPPPPRPRAICV